MNLSKAVAVRLDKLLKEKGMTLYSLHKKTGISIDTFKSIRKGKAKGVNLKTVVLIAEGFGMNVWDFLNDPMFTYISLSL